MINLNNLQYTYIIANIFNVYTLGYFMNGFFVKKEINKKLEIILYIVYYLVSTLLVIKIGQPKMNLFINTVALFLIALIYSRNYLKSLRIMIIIYTLTFCIESAVYAMVQLINSSYFSGVLNKDNEMIIGLIICKILTYIFVVYFVRTKTVKNGFEVSKIPIFLLVLFPVVSTLVTIIILLPTYNLWIILVSTVCLFLLNIYIFYLYDKITRDYEDEVEYCKMLERNKMYIAQLNLFDKSLSDARSLQHDIKNQMIALKEYLNRGQLEEAKICIDEKYKILVKPKKILETDNALLDSIINYKVSQAKENDVEFDLNVKVPTKLEVSDLDMVSILGNLLDNAIENVTVQNGKKTIYLKVFYVQNILLIKISNYYSKKLIYDKNFKFTTTKADKRNHGIGLKNVKAIILKNNGNLEFKISDNIFSVKIQLII